MKRSLNIVILILITLHCSSGQSRFGVECKVSILKTQNKGHLVGGGGGYTSYMVTREGDPVTLSYSAGIVYKLHERHLLKLHVGKHKNGRILDITETDDTFHSNSYAAVDLPYHYFQIAPSYTYRILNKKWIVPVEIGFNVNKRIREHDIFFVAINKYNFDYRVNAGVQYSLYPQLRVGLHGVYTRNLNEYQNKQYELGTYKPQQFGLEVSVQGGW